MTKRDLFIYIIYAITGFLFGAYILGPLLAHADAKPMYDVGKVVSIAKVHEGTSPRYVIAVLDTGYDPARATVPAKLCKKGHYDYHMGTPNLNFVDPHGTYVTNIIAEKLKDVDYCILVYQVWTDATRVHGVDLGDALDKALDAGAMVSNISLGGSEFDGPTLRSAIERASALKAPVFVAAGNSALNLDKSCVVFPACYRYTDIILVGGQSPDNPAKRWSDSNYGKVVDVWAPVYYDDGKVSMVGTSFAAPRALAEYILFLEHKRLAVEK